MNVEIMSKLRFNDDRSTAKKKISSAGLTCFLLALLTMLTLLSGLSSYNMMRKFNQAYNISLDNAIDVASRSTKVGNKPHRGLSIPRRLIFTYKYNLLNPSKDDPPFDQNDPLTANVLNTIDRYKQYWKEADELEHASNPDVTISFLSNEDCINVIKKVQPKLVKHFTKEKRGDLKADICRIAELLQFGGYYFDADISVVEPINLQNLPIQEEEISDPVTQLEHLEKGSEMIVPSEDDVVTFATVVNVQGVFFQAFMAAMPNHPTIQRALDYILAYYEGFLEDLIPEDALPKLARYSETIPSRKNPQGIGLGCYTLAAAYIATTDNEWDKFINNLDPDGRHSLNKNHSGVKSKMNYSRFLYEVSLTSNHVIERGLFQDVALQSKKKGKFGDGDWCNFACFCGNKVYFYSRVVGSRGCKK